MGRVLLPELPLRDILELMAAAWLRPLLTWLKMLLAGAARAMSLPTAPTGGAPVSEEQGVWAFRVSDSVWRHAVQASNGYAFAAHLVRVAAHHCAETVHRLCCSLAAACCTQLCIHTDRSCKGPLCSPSCEGRCHLRLNKGCRPHSRSSYAHLVMEAACLCQ